MRVASQVNRARRRAGAVADAQGGGQKDQQPPDRRAEFHPTSGVALPLDAVGSLADG